MKKQSSKSNLLRQFAKRRGSVKEFAEQHGVSVSSLYRWQDEQDSGEFVMIQPEDKSPCDGLQLILQKGDLRIEFTELPEFAYLQSTIKIMLLC